MIWFCQILTRGTSFKTHTLSLEARRARLGSVESPSKIPTDNSTEKQHDLEQEPSPAARLLLSLRWTSTSTTRAVSAATASIVLVVDRVQVLGLQ